MDRFLNAVSALLAFTALGAILSGCFGESPPQSAAEAPRAAGAALELQAALAPADPPDLLRLPHDVVPVARFEPPPLPPAWSFFDPSPSSAGPVILAVPPDSESRLVRRTPPVDDAEDSSGEPAAKDTAVANEQHGRPLDAAISREALAPGLQSANDQRHPSFNDPWSETANIIPPQAISRAEELPTAAPLTAVAERADVHTQRGVSLAERGAYYSARAEFIQALRLVSQALDAQRGGQIHSQSLADGLQALNEAEDFAPKGSRLEADLDVPRIVAAHRTPVLKEASDAEMTPLAALQRYFVYAQEQLAQACGNEPAASAALYALGKLHMALADQSMAEPKLNGPKAMAFHRAALRVDSQNYRAASELGVLLARYGQWREARQVLRHSVAISPQPAAWHNLSVVHQQLGELDLARRARYEWRLAVEGSPQDTTKDAASWPDLSVRWVDAETFSRTGPMDGREGARRPTAELQTQPQKKQAAAWWPLGRPSPR